METLEITIGTGMVGSRVTADLGCTKEEWLEMSEDEQTEAINEAVWNAIDVSGPVID